MRKKTVALFNHIRNGKVGRRFKRMVTSLSYKSSVSSLSFLSCWRVDYINIHSIMFSPVWVAPALLATAPPTRLYIQYDAVDVHIYREPDVFVCCVLKLLFFYAFQVNRQVTLLGQIKNTVYEFTYNKRLPCHERLDFTVEMTEGGVSCSSLL